LEASSAPRFVRTRPAGGAYLLRALRDQLHIRACPLAPVKERKFTTPIQEEIVANRALDPSSKLAIEQWTADEVYLGDEQAFQVQHFYRAMDFLLEHAEKIQEDVFWSTANTF
ncbi:MAG: IS1634 family transposase, partial [Thermodesulfobacteriota bacterium]